jgi:hypothetical protein
MAGLDLLSATEQMISEFSQRIRELETLALLRNTTGNAGEELNEFSNVLGRVEQAFEELVSMVDRESAAVNKTNQLVKRLTAANQRTRRLEKHLTSKVSCQAPQSIKALFLPNASFICS